MINVLLFFITIVITTAITPSQKTLANYEENVSFQVYEENASFQVYEENPLDRNLMTEAVLNKLTIWINKKTGERIYHISCRKLKHGCEYQISQLVDYIFDISAEENFNPWLLAAIMWHESNFYPFAISHCGAVGTVQLLGRSPWSKGIKFVHNKRYRRYCRNKLGACQQDVIKRGVYHLKKSFTYCGSVEQGLRRYNSGRCDGPKKYPRNIFREMRDFKRKINDMNKNYCE